MGLARKTISIGTLGLVSYRSKNERLARSEAALTRAHELLARRQADVERERASRQLVELDSAQVSRKLRRAERRLSKRSAAKSARRAQRAQHVAEMLATAEQHVEDRFEQASKKVSGLTG